MRKKIEDNKKKLTIGISIHKELLEILDEYSKEIDSNRSEIIEDLLKKYLEKDKL